uniref:Putative no on or off transient a n=1 Tax=Corethrella appendiculata TaxID=1370023 RepID=U5ESB0_9DIPT
MEIKPELNCTPLPRRNTGGNVDKKPAVAGNQQQPAEQPQQQNQSNSGGGNQQNQGRNQNQGGQNRNQGGGNQGGGGNRNQGGNQNNRGFGNNQNRGQNDRNQRGGNNQNRGGGNRQQNEGNDRRDGDRRDGDRGDRRDGRGKQSEDFILQQKLKQLQGQILLELPTIEPQEIKFSGRNRLYIGNLTNDVTEEELAELFKPYGDISESFINKDKNFAFLKVDYRANAEKAKKELDGSMRKNRPLRIRFAPNATNIRVKNLTPQVSNELLHKSFEAFGQVERAVIIVDDRGKPTGEGIVEFARKAAAQQAIRYCTDRCFFLTSSLRPCVVEPFEHIDDTDGYPEKSLNKKGQDFFKARQAGPRFAELGSFEHEYGQRWKQMHELFKQKVEQLKREMQMEEEQLEAQMEYAKYEHETELLREQLRAREQDRDRQKMEWEVKERQAQEQRLRNEQQMKTEQDEMQIRMQRSEDELRRRQQENTLFMQAQQLNSMLDKQEMNQGGGHEGNNRRTYDMMNQGVNGNNYQNDDDDAVIEIIIIIIIIIIIKEHQRFSNI